VSKKKLGVVSPASQGLGLPTIMDPELAGARGVRYVHLVAFAIDVDRVRDEVETEAMDPRWPFGFEVFLTEAWILEGLDPRAERAIIETACASAMKKSTRTPGQLLGAQLPFAVYDAVARGALPDDLRPLFRAWKSPPRELMRELAPLWEDAEAEKRRLAKACLEVEMDPPLAPPTVATLTTWASEPSEASRR
jgi:hypothetical protein